MNEKKERSPQGKSGEKKGIIDKEGRLFGAISIIDVAAILALVALCFGFYLKNNVLEATGGAVKDVGIEVTILVEIIPEYLEQAIEVGDELFDHDHATGGPIGVITSKTILPPESLVALNDGSYQMVTSEAGTNVLLTVVGKGTHTNGRYSFNRVYELGVNASRYFQSKYALFIGTVIDISEATLTT